MAHDNSSFNLSPAEREFNDLINHADDFFKIELLRQAKSWYKKALSLNMQTDMVKSRIEECERLLAFENKVVVILAAIAAFGILGYILLAR